MRVILVTPGVRIVLLAPGVRFVFGPRCVVPMGTLAALRLAAYPGVVVQLLWGASFGLL